MALLQEIKIKQLVDDTFSSVGRTPTNTPATANGAKVDTETSAFADSAELSFAVVNHLGDDSTPGMRNLGKLPVTFVD